ncbi:MAG: 3-phosphoshikimate 1-carboxyvinyltransferase [Abitibacteriaceae bacterium]|nr:3-phosphoshikimate 1-carboxyvinyltransferase [Abditibacteriaceae bacterium]
MDYLIRSALSVNGTIRVAPDKSISHRAFMFGALATGMTTINNFLWADDTEATLDGLRALGVNIPQVEPEVNTLTIIGHGFDALKKPQTELNCGNSGTSMRLLAGILAGRPWASTLVGDASLNKRPMDRVQQPLSLMGAQIDGQGARCTPPLSIRGGNLQGIEYRLPVASAQVKSAILLAGLQAQGTTAVIEPTPTRDHTERMLKAFGVPVHQEQGRISVNADYPLIAPQAPIEVPGDISSAAYFLVAAALRPGWQVTVTNVGINTTRTGILDVLQAMGATISLDNQHTSGDEPIADVTVQGAPLHAAEIGGAIIPRLIDELPVLALLATQAEGQTVIRDAAELRNKESDRIAIITTELRKLGAQIEETTDGMIITGPTKLTGTTVTSPRGDHRIAMTLAVAGLIAEGTTVIENAEATTSSFPGFLVRLSDVAQR